jgi:hypothetical protein
VKARRLLLKTIVAALCLTAGVAIVMLLAGTLDRTSAQILLTSTEVSFFGFSLCRPGCSSNEVAARGWGSRAPLSRRWPSA